MVRAMKFNRYHALKVIGKILALAGGALGILSGLKTFIENFPPLQQQQRWPHWVELVPSIPVELYGTVQIGAYWPIAAAFGTMSIGAALEFFAKQKLKRINDL